MYATNLRVQFRIHAVFARTVAGVPTHVIPVWKRGTLDASICRVGIAFFFHGGVLLTYYVYGR